MPELIERILKSIRRFFKSMGKKKSVAAVAETNIPETSGEEMLKDEVVVKDEATEIEIKEEPIMDQENKDLTTEAVETKEPATCACGEAACDCDKCGSCNGRNETTYTAPCAVGDEVYRTTIDTDDSGNISYKVQKGKVIAITIDENQAVWLRVNLGVNLPVLNLKAEEYDYNTTEVGERILALQK